MIHGSDFLVKENSPSLELQFESLLILDSKSSKCQPLLRTAADVGCLRVGVTLLDQPMEQPKAGDA